MFITWIIIFCVMLQLICKNNFQQLRKVFIILTASSWNTEIDFLCYIYEETGI